jgi:hypothetical protein
MQHPAREYCSSAVRQKLRTTRIGYRLMFRCRFKAMMVLAKMRAQVFMPTPSTTEEVGIASWSSS